MVNPAQLETRSRDVHVALRQSNGLRSSRLFAVAGTFAVAAAIAAFEVTHRHGLMPDDAFITFRYARNFGDGHGWHYNPGLTTSNAATSFLWTSTLSIAYRLTGSVVGSAQLLFAFSVAGTATIIVESFRRLGSAATGIAAGALLLTSPWVLLTTGTEYGLLLLLLAAAVSCALVWERPGGAGAFAALACFARGEAIVLLLLLAAIIFVTRRTGIRRFMIGVVAVGVPTLLLMRAITGTVTPGTLDAKVAQGESGFWGHGFLFLRALIDTPGAIGFSVWWDTMLVLAAAGVLLQRRRLAGFCGPFVLFGLALVIVYGLVLRVPQYPWYVAPISFAVTLLAAITIGRVVELVGAHSAVVAVVVFAGSLVAAMTVAAQGPNGSDFREYAVAADWINQHTPPGATVAATEIGVFGWNTDRTIVDYLGLLDSRDVQNLQQGDLTTWLARDHPDYWIIHDPPWPFETAIGSSEFKTHYRQVALIATPYSSRTKALVICERI